MTRGAGVPRVLPGGLIPEGCALWRWHAARGRFAPPVTLPYNPRSCLWQPAPEVA